MPSSSRRRGIGASRRCDQLARIDSDATSPTNALHPVIRTNTRSIPHVNRSIPAYPSDGMVDTHEHLHKEAQYVEQGRIFSKPLSKTMCLLTSSWRGRAGKRSMRCWTAATRTCGSLRRRAEGVGGGASHRVWRGGAVDRQVDSRHRRAYAGRHRACPGQARTLTPTGERLRLLRDVAT